MNIGAETSAWRITFGFDKKARSLCDLISVNVQLIRRVISFNPETAVRDSRPRKAAIRSARGIQMRWVSTTSTALGLATSPIFIEHNPQSGQPSVDFFDSLRYEAPDQLPAPVPKAGTWLGGRAPKHYLVNLTDDELASLAPLGCLCSIAVRFGKLALMEYNSGEIHSFF